MNPATFKALQRITEYLHDREERSWEDENKPLKHIFQDVRTVERWIKQEEPTSISQI